MELHNRASVKDIGLAYLGRGASDLDSGAFNRTRGIIDNLVLDKVVQVRYMHIAFGSISIALAFWVIVRIWYDSWRASQLQVRLRPQKWAFLYNLHPAESFPLILGLLILVQMFSFVLIQAAALKSVFVPQCRISSQVVLTQIFITGFFHLVFGFEMTIRALKKNRFSPRRRYTTTICVLISLVLTILTWLATRIRPPGNKCFGDMIWRSLKSSEIGIVICAVLVPSFISMALIIGIQLYRTARIDQNERISGTRMVYYLVLSAVLYIMILPFWIQAKMGTFDTSLTSSRIAEFVLFISGAAIAFVHMFLRANAVRTAIKPSTAVWHERRKFRLCGPSDLELMNISAPILENKYNPNEKVADIWARQQAEKGIAKVQPALPEVTYSTKTNQSNTGWPIQERPATPPKDASTSTLSPKAGSSSKLPEHKRNHTSYSLFPGPDDVQLPATVYTPSSQAYSPRTIQPTRIGHTSTKGLALKLTSPSVTDIREDAVRKPPVPWASGHRRGSSADSSATVQIGIRFSAAPATLTSNVYQSTMKETPRRPSLRGVIDNINSSQSQRTPTAPPTSGILEKPFDPKWNFPQLSSPDSDARQRGLSDASAESDFAWLKTTEQEPSAMYRQNSQRSIAETNRFEIAALERSSSSARARPGYKAPQTPERSGNGFF